MRVRVAALLALFVVIFSILEMTRATRLSSTWDEPMHLTAGYLALTARDFRVDPSHPPFIRAWAAIPLALSDRSLDTHVIDQTGVRQWLSDGYAFARTFVSGTDIDWTLLSARAMVIAWGVLLGAAVFAWAYEWMGLAAGALALLLYALEPNIAAHTALVTTDAALATLVFAAVYFLWRFARGRGGWNQVGVAICVALAAVTKFSAVLLAPMLGLLVVLGVGRRMISVRQAAVLVGLTAAVTFVTIWAAYGFSYTPSANPSWLLTRESFGGSVDASWLASGLVWLDAHRVLPNAFAQGLLFSLSSARELPAFLAGEVRTGGWWYYFPVALSLKTPLALLALCGAGAIVTIRRRSDAVLTPAFVLIPVAVWLIAAAFSGVNIGIRHVLPVYPFLILLATVAASELFARGRAARLVAGVAIALVAVEVGRSEPYPLSFFNTLAGGPANGFRYLADSNLGWGGPLKALKRWMDERGVTAINLAYFGSVDPALYGIRATYLPSSATFLEERMTRPQLPGYVAISGTTLDGVYLPSWWRRFYAGFHDREPVAVVANTMRIYWVDRWPDHPDPSLDSESLQTLADGLLFGLRWPEHAVVVYDEYLQRNPRDAGAWNGRSLALAQTGRFTEALDGFRRVLTLSPADPDARRNVALLEHQIRQASMVRE